MSQATPVTTTVTAMMVADAASRALGIELVETAPGRAVVRMTVREDMVNGHAIAHGGLILAPADTAFACACNSCGPPTVAEAVVRTRVGRTGVYDVTVGRDHQVIAEFRGHSHELSDSSAA